MALTKSEFATPRVAVPVPIFVRLVTFAFMAVEMRVFPAPASVSPNAPLIPVAPPSVRVSESEPIVDALASVIGPVQVLLPETFCNAPPVLMPVLFRVNGSAA